MFGNKLFWLCFALVTAVAGNCTGDLLVHYAFDETGGNIATDSTGGNNGTVADGSWVTPGARPHTDPGQHLSIANRKEKADATAR